MTVQVDIGATQGGTRAAFDLEELLSTRLLVQGNSGSGKSHLLRRLIEQSAGWVQQAILDPEGDFVTLAEAYGHVVVDASAHPEAALQQIGARVRQHRVSVVLNLENLEVERQMRHAAAFLGGLFEAERDHWYPMLVVVDEAQMFAPAVAGDVSDEARKASLGAMTNLMCRGRKRGLAGVIATQRLAKLAKNVAAEASNFLMGRTFLDIDMARAADLLGMERRQAEMFRDLGRGTFIALGPAISPRPLKVAVGEVKTAPRALGPRLTPLPETAPEDARDLIMQEETTPLPLPLPSPPLPRPTTEDVLADLCAREQEEEATAQPEALAPPDLFTPPPDYDGVLREMMADPDAAYRPVAVLYQDFLVRCRSRKINGRALDLPKFRRRLAVAKAGVDDQTAEHPQWPQALAAAGAVPEDLQPLYLLLARAALDAQPCPSDAALAKARGSRSPRRARGLLDHMEQAGYLISRQDLYGKRVIALPALGWETAPGDPDAAEEG